MRIKHPTRLIQLDELGMHWLHQCQECEWQQLICEHTDSGKDAVRIAAEGHPAPSSGRRLLITLIRPAEDQPTDGTP